MAFKILNQEGEIEIVNQIDWSKHRHNSWREFLPEEVESLNWLKWTTWEPRTLEQAREDYQYQLGKPCPNNKKNALEWIENKLD